ncbi:hypothetical protein niasHT_012568 [Heterodera trifolii]|uniref:KIF-binding protein n=1 Tax=Heterodera trifolii TaxID=157864 RepID=A0ABD2L1F7_9BILA
MFSKNPTDAKTAEIVISLRLTFEKIIQNFLAVYSYYNLQLPKKSKVSKKAAKFVARLAEIWELEFWAVALIQIANKDSGALVMLYDALYVLAVMLTLGKNGQHITKMPTELSPRSAEGLLADCERTIRAQFYEEHTSNMLRFYENGMLAHDGGNSFSNFLAKCQLDGCDHKLRVRIFYANGEKMTNDHYDKMVTKYPKLKQMLRIGSFKENEHLLSASADNGGKREQLDNRLAEFEILMNGAMEAIPMEEIDQNEHRLLSDLFEKKNELFGEKIAPKYSKNPCAREKHLQFLFNLHESAMNKLMEGKDAFTKRLKEGARLSDFDKQLMRSYEAIMVDGMAMAGESAKKQIGINGLYFHHKTIIFGLISEIGEDKKKLEKFGNELAKLKVKVAELKLNSLPSDDDEKRRRICWMKMFLKWFMGKVAEKKEPTPTGLISKPEVRSIFWLPATPLSQTAKPFSKLQMEFEDLDENDCKDARYLQSYFDVLLSSANYTLAVNVFSVIQLLDHSPQFVQFVNDNCIQFGAIGANENSSLDEEEIFKLYITYFETNDVEKMHKYEAIIGLKFLLNNVRLIEADFIPKLKKARDEKAQKMAKFRAEMLAMLKMFDFCMESVDQLIRMSCPLIEYKALFSKFYLKSAAAPLAEWQPPFDCLTKSFGQILSDFRNTVAIQHFQFIQMALDKDRQGKLAQILREKEDTFMRLENLIGEEMFKYLWNKSENRQKLFNQKFFDDKKRLFGHYHNAMANPCEKQRATERLMADLAMFSDYLWGIRRMTTSIKLRKEIEQQIEHFWLLLRSAYDGFSMLKRGDIEQQKLSQLSFIQANIISGEFLFKN